VSDIAASFRRPFDAQVAAYRLRLGNLVPTARWDDLSHAEHDRAFVVAGAVKADLLADLGAAVDRAISEGTGFEAFKTSFRTIVEQHGWHGWTGEGTARGEAWRMRVIYRTNMLTSYAAGRMAQLVDGKFKFWVYRHGNALEPRLLHLAWNGTALPPDHPFWATHYPPNDWGCTCYVTGARTEAGIRRVGGDPGKQLPDGWEGLNPKTGTPAGVGKGWDYAPGASAVDDVLATVKAKAEVLPPQIAADLIQSTVQMDAFADWFAAPRGNWPLLRLSDADAALVGSQRRVAVLSADSAVKQSLNHSDLVPDDYALAQAVVDHATRRIKQDARTVLFIREVDGDQGHVLVVKAVVENDELFVVSFRRLSRDAARRDRDIRNLLRKAE